MFFKITLIKKKQIKISNSHLMLFFWVDKLPFHYRNLKKVNSH